MRLLIVGDSFAADWSVKYKDYPGWPTLMANTFDVTNLAQAGCSEYKIYLQLKSADLTKFDAIIVSHTSPNRIYIKEHPVHKNDPLHKNCDLIYADISAHRPDYPELDCAARFYELYFEPDHAIFMFNLLCEKIESTLQGFPGKIIHLTNMPWDPTMYKFENMISFIHLFKNRRHRGIINHFDAQANQIVYNTLKDQLNRDI